MLYGIKFKHIRRFVVYFCCAALLYHFILLTPRDQKRNYNRQSLDHLRQSFENYNVRKKFLYPEDKTFNGENGKHSDDNQNAISKKFSENTYNPFNEKIPNILVWTLSTPMEKNGLELVISKEFGSCKVTMDRSTLNKSIAVVLFNNNKKLDPLDTPDPQTRNEKQFYVFWSPETPAKTHRFKDLQSNPLFDSIFNLSMTMLPTADVRLGFGSYRRALETSNRLKMTTDQSSPLWRKEKVAIWGLSNCYGLPGANERIAYAKSLVQAGLKLDKFGECFRGARDNSRFRDIVGAYNFYLSFENSLHCPGYITEKFWRNAFMAGLVPVVWGPAKQDVLNVAPPNSFIHAEDFETPKDLVNYLNYLVKNKTAYIEYHKWRNTPVNSVPDDDIAHGVAEVFNKLCKRLVVEKQIPKTIPSITKLVYETGYIDDKCLRPIEVLSEKLKKEMLNFK